MFQIVVVVLLVVAVGLLAHSAWVIHYALTRARIDQRLRDFTK